MKTAFKLALLLVLVLSACHKKAPQPEAPAPIVTPALKTEYKIVQVTCYPNNITVVTYSIQASDGTAPYSYKWTSPSTNSGPGPFTTTVSSVLNLNLVTTDANNSSLSSQFTIKNNSFDSLQYDYRKNLIGSYACTKVYSQAILGPNNNWVTTTYTSVVTVEIKTNAAVNKLTIPGLFQFPGEVTCYYKNNSTYFYNYRANGKIMGDTIDFSNWDNPIGNPNASYFGKKIR